MAKSIRPQIHEIEVYDSGARKSDEPEYIRFNNHGEILEWLTLSPYFEGHVPVPLDYLRAAHTTKFNKVSAQIAADLEYRNSKEEREDARADEQIDLDRDDSLTREGA